MKAKNKKGGPEMKSKKTHHQQYHFGKLDRRKQGEKKYAKKIKQNLSKETTVIVSKIGSLKSPQFLGKAI